MVLDIEQAQTDLNKVLGREKAPTRGEMTSYLLGYAQGLLAREGLGPAAGPVPTEPPGMLIKCQHCGQETPIDSPFCIHCHRKPK